MRPTSRRLYVGVTCALTALVLVTTCGRFGNQFVFDDDHVIAQGSVIHDPSQLVAVWTHHTMFAADNDPGVQSIDTYRPVPITLFMVDAAISGRAPWMYHLSNLLLHLACVLLVFSLALAWIDRETPARLMAASYGAAFFAVSPWLVEAHVWINGRSDPLCLLFGLLGLLALLRAEASSDARVDRRLAIAASLALLLGFFSKETLLLALPAVLVLPALPGRRRNFGLRALASAAPALAYLTVRVSVLDGVRAARDQSDLLAAAQRLPWLIADSLRQSLVPSVPYLRSLRDEYAELGTLEMGAGLLVCAAIASAVILTRKRAPLIAGGLVWFALPLTPIAILGGVLWPGFGRYLYVPMAGLAWALTHSAVWLHERSSSPRLLGGAAALHILLLAALTVNFTLDFRDDEHLYAAAIEARPEVAMGHGWLGLSRLRRDDAAGAVAPLMRATNLDPETHRYALGATRALLLSGERVRAEALALRSIERFGERPEAAAFHLLAINSASRPTPEYVVDHLLRCLDVWPERPDCVSALRGLVTTHAAAPLHRRAVARIIADHRPATRRSVAALLRP